QDEQMLHACARSHGVTRHVVRGHPVGDFADPAEDAPQSSGCALLGVLGLVRHGWLLSRLPCRAVRTARERSGAWRWCHTPCRWYSCWSVNSRSRITRRFHVSIWGTTYGSKP